MIITDITVEDVRVPTSDTLLGSDPFHRKPDYSAVVIQLNTSESLSGNSLVFNIGAGNDWLAYGVRDLAVLLQGMPFSDFTESPNAIYERLIDHHQMRWLADGVFRMAAGGLLNALWDLWAKQQNKPLWQLLVDLPAEQLVQCINWRYLKDALTPAEALKILNAQQPRVEEKKAQYLVKGPAAYSTSGWLGLSDDEIVSHIEKLKQQGFRHFKAKVGTSLPEDIDRLTQLRRVIGDDAHLMTDANQIWGVDDAIAWMHELAHLHPYWIEEPTARDDVTGFIKIRQAMQPLGIGVAAGEQVPSPVIFKQLLASGAITHCQIDATRLGGVNDVISVILMAAKYNIPVCPHGGGIGLCNMIRHYSLWDQISVSGTSDHRFVEYYDAQQHGVFTTPIEVKDGCYVTPTQPGWGVEMHNNFIEAHRFPDSALWANREGPVGPLFIA
ncbi:MAG: enolase C-terminal domain-like protein [Pseudomonadota bacterium]